MIRDRLRATRALGWFVLLASAIVSPCAFAPACAQDFGAPRATALDPGALGFLENALPPERPGPVLEAASVLWYGTPLTTRALAAGVGWRGLRVAVGVSQSGEPEIGWTTLGLGVGVVERSGGAGVRVVARRDRTSDFALDAPPGATGLEAGAGAWVAPGRAWRVWALLPQVAGAGSAPPLERPLESGVRLDLPGLRLWLASTAAPRRYAAASLGCGAEAPLGPARIWVAARDAPLAGSLGVAFAWGALRGSSEVESHPWLPPVSRMAVGIGAPGP